MQERIYNPVVEFVFPGMSRLHALIEALNSQSLSEVVKLHSKIGLDLLPLVDRLTAQDLEIYSVPQFPKKVWFYYPIRETEVFTLAVFALPKGMKLPLHDHPNMTVLCKPLLGKFAQRISSNDLGLLQASSVVSAGDPCFLVESGTVHEVEALEDAAFLDLVLPPYNEEYGDRKIKYFLCEKSGKLVHSAMPASNVSIRMSNEITNKFNN